MTNHLTRPVGSGNLLDMTTTPNPLDLTDATVVLVRYQTSIGPQHSAALYLGDTPTSISCGHGHKTPAAATRCAARIADRPAPPTTAQVIGADLNGNTLVETTRPSTVPGAIEARGRYSVGPTALAYLGDDIEVLP